MQTDPSYDGPLLTVAEAAERLRLHENSVRRLVASGEIPAHRRKGRCTRIFIPESSLNDYLRGITIR